MGLRLNVKNVTDLIAKLKRLGGELEDMTPLWNDVGQIMVEHIGETFETEGFATWAPLKAATVREKERQGYPPDPMIRTGRLLDSLTDPEQAAAVEQGRSTLGTFTEKAFSWGTDLDYAAYHAEGPEHNPKLPIRDVIIVTPRLVARVDEAAEDFLHDAARRAGL